MLKIGHRVCGSSRTEIADLVEEYRCREDEEKGVVGHHEENVEWAAGYVVAQDELQGRIVVLVDSSNKEADAEENETEDGSFSQEKAGQAEGGVSYDAGDPKWEGPFEFGRGASRSPPGSI